MDRNIDELMKKKALKTLLNKDKLDIKRLKADNEQLKKYHKKSIGLFFIFLSGVIFLSSVLLLITDLQLILICFISIALISFALYFIFIYSSKKYYFRLISAVLETAIFNLNHALSRFHLEKYAIFLPDREEIYQFIPFITKPPLQMFPPIEKIKKSIFEVPNKGIILHSAGKVILELIINEFKIKPRKIDLNEFEALLQEILIHKLNLVKTLKFTQDGKSRFVLVLTENYFSDIYQLDKINSDFNPHLGDPICNFIASFLARRTNQPILSELRELNQEKKEYIVHFKLGKVYY